MRNNTGWIKLNRKMLDWEWINDHNTFALFVYCLLRANWKDGRWQGVEIKRGSFATSLPGLAKSTGLSLRQVRTALLHLETTQSVTRKAYPKFSVITVVNYDRYQDSDTIDDSQMTGERQASDSQATTIEESKNKKKERIPPISPQGDSTTQSEERVKIEYNNPEFYEKYKMADGWENDGNGYIVRKVKKRGKR